MYLLSQNNFEEIQPITFTDMNMKEKDIEELLRRNIEIITDEEESLLIIGDQVKNKENARSDLTAIDHNGNIVLIEIKRDLKDIIQRTEAFEFQAIRYAASYATIETIEEAADKVYEPYIIKYQEEFKEDLKYYTISEIANRKISQFLETNNTLDFFNRGQRIILVASDFDSQTLSAVAWLNENGVQISCYKLTPYQFNNQYILNSEKIIPMTTNEEYFVEISNRKQVKENNNHKRISTPRLKEMLSWNVVQVGDTIRPKNTDIKGSILENGLIMDKDKEKSLYQFVKDALEWSSVKPYTLSIHEKTGKSLSDIRLEYMKNNNMI